MSQSIPHSMAAGLTRIAHAIADAERFQAYRTQNPWQVLLRDISAGLVVAMVAIPLCIGIAIASGLEPRHGITTAVITGILGGLFGGSKYQVYGPTAAFITVVAGIVHQHGVPVLIISSLVAGIILFCLGTYRLGAWFNRIPHAIVVGFTLGIAATIIISQLPDFMGHAQTSRHLWDRLAVLPELFTNINAHAALIGAITFVLIREIHRVSVLIPAPLVAIVVGTYLANWVWHDNFIPLIATRYGTLEHHIFQWSLPSVDAFHLSQLVLPVCSIVFIAALESVLSARMADRMADEQTPFNPNREMQGQGIINFFAPLLSGMPATGALARTATNIKVGALSPVACLMHSVFVLILIVFFSRHLSYIPMSCIGGLLIYVATAMVKLEEVREIIRGHWFFSTLMVFTALMTLLTDLAIAVGASVLLYAVLRRFFILQPDTPRFHFRTDSMKKVVLGLEKFKRQVFPNRKELFVKLSQRQAPKILFITCSDSRIDPNLLTGSDPGDLFILRNAGNVVPPYDLHRTTGELATIEYAVSVLGVSDIIVCGHTDCGVINALLHQVPVPDAVDNWLENVKSAYPEPCHDEDEASDRTMQATQNNVLLQLERLRAIPAVGEAIGKKRLALHGWIYNIAQGEVTIHHPTENQFLPILPLLRQADLY